LGVLSKAAAVAAFVVLYTHAITSYHCLKNDLVQHFKMGATIEKIPNFTIK
jgi:hypothetical protein